MADGRTDRYIHTSVSLFPSSVEQPSLINYLSTLTAGLRVSIKSISPAESRTVQEPPKGISRLYSSWSTTMEKTLIILPLRDAIKDSVLASRKSHHGNLSKMHGRINHGNERSQAVSSSSWYTISRAHLPTALHYICVCVFLRSSVLYRRKVGRYLQSVLKTTNPSRNPWFSSDRKSSSILLT